METEEEKRAAAEAAAAAEAQSKAEQDRKNSEDSTPPPVRHHPSYYVEQRKNARARQEEEEDQDDIDARVDSKVNEHLSKFSETIDSTNRERDLREFLQENPEFKEDERKIAKWWSDPSRRHLPLSTVALEAVGQAKLRKIYAEQALRDEREARQTKVGGSVARREGSSIALTPEKIATMTDKELDAAIKANT
jgi:hypothetical protein